MIDKEDFFDYVEFIDDYEKSFDYSKRIIPIDRIIKKKQIKNESPKQKAKMIFPFKDYIKLSIECKELVSEAEFDSNKQFEIGFYLIEGEQNFPKKPEIGIKYLEKSIENGNVEAAVYLLNN